jgi:DNA-binding NtrC family response regulator
VRILVVDDDAAVRMALRVTLEYEGYQVVGASNGWEALALIESEKPDVVLLDVEMPGLGGLAVLRRLQTKHESLPVVVMSAHATSATRVEAVSAGAVDVLEKPFDSSDRLRSTIHGAIERTRGRQPDPDRRPAAIVDR